MKIAEFLTTSHCAQPVSINKKKLNNWLKLLMI